MAAWPYCWPWPKVRALVLERDQHVCQIRGPRCTVHATDADHIVPPNEGGAAFDPSNVRAACPQCNRGRGQARLSAMARLNRQEATEPSRVW